MSYNHGKNNGLCHNSGSLDGLLNLNRMTTNFLSPENNDSKYWRGYRRGMIEKESPLFPRKKLALDALLIYLFGLKNQYPVTYSQLADCILTENYQEIRNTLEELATCCQDFLILFLIGEILTNE